MFCTEVIAVSPHITATGIYVSMTKRHLTTWGYSLWEVEIYGPDGKMDLREAEVEVSSVERGREDTPLCCKGSYATDGDMGTRWGSAHRSDEEGKEPQWLKVTLSSPAVIHRVVLRWEKAYAEEYCVTIIPAR